MNTTSTTHIDMFSNRSIHQNLVRVVSLKFCALLLLPAIFADDPLQQPAECQVTLWVVSSRRAPQQPTGKTLTNSLDYYYSDQAGQLHLATENLFTQSLKPEVPCCLFVHGSFMRWQDIFLDCQQVSEWVQAAQPNQSVQIVYYTWPSDGYLTMLPQLDIGILGRRGEFNGLYLTQVISQIPQQCPLLLMGHSFGCRSVTSATHLLGGGMIQGYRLPTPQQDRHRLRVLLLAAAIDHHWLNPGERYGNSLCRVEQLVSLRNREDFALSLYPLRKLFARGALGREGLKQQDELVLGSLNQKVSEMDVTHLIGTGHGWPHYYKQKQIASSLGEYMYFTDHQSHESVSQRKIRSSQNTHATVHLKIPLRETYSHIRRISVKRHH